MEETWGFNILAECAKSSVIRFRPLLSVYHGPYSLIFARFVDAGFQLSLSGFTTRRCKSGGQQVVCGKPLKTLFLESEAPLLPPGLSFFQTGFIFYKNGHYRHCGGVYSRDSLYCCWL